MKDLSDQHLLKRFVRGDREAFDQIYRRYAARMHATAYRLTGNWEDAEDVLHEVFVNLAHKAGAIRKGKALGGWLYRTTINSSNTTLRNRGRRVSIQEDNPGAEKIIEIESLHREARHQESKTREEMLLQIEATIPLLPERQSAVFVLRYYQGLSHAEIAGILDISEGTAKSHHSLACRKIRELIQAEDDSQERVRKEDQS